MRLHFTFMIEALLADAARVAFVIRMHHIHVCIVIAAIFNHFQAQTAFHGLMPIGVMFSQGIVILIGGLA